MNTPLKDLPTASVYHAPPLAYGTHDRNGPWWRRWLRAWFRALKPAAVVAVIAAALAYSLGDRQYTATTSLQVDANSVVSPDDSPVTVATLDVRTDAVARDARSGATLNRVLRSPEWVKARVRRSGRIGDVPLDSTFDKGTGVVRVRFTDSDPEAARAAADAAVALVIEDAESQVKEHAKRLKRAEQVEAKLVDLALKAPVKGNVSEEDRQGILDSRRRAAQRRARVAIQPAPVALRPLARAQVPRLASNQGELGTKSALAAAAVLPIAFLIVLYGQWRYRGADTAQPSASTPSDAARLNPGSWHWANWRRAARRAVGPALAGAVAAALLALIVTPWLYTARTTLTLKPLPPAAAGSQIQPAEVYAIYADAARSRTTLARTLGSSAWRASRGTDDLPIPFPLDVHTDGTSIELRFTDYDRDGARAGAQAIAEAMNESAQTAVSMIRPPTTLPASRAPMLPPPLPRSRPPGTRLTPDETAAMRKRLDEQRRHAQAEMAIRLRQSNLQLLIASTGFTATPATVSWLPTNWASLLKTSALWGTGGFAALLGIAVTWSRLLALRTRTQVASIPVGALPS